MRKLFAVVLLLVSFQVSGQVINRSKDFIYKNSVSVGRQSEQPTGDHLWFRVGDSATIKAMLIPQVKHRDSVVYPRNRGTFIWDLNAGLPFWWDGGKWITIDTSYGSVGGTGITLINTSFGLFGGPVTSEGTLQVDTTQMTTLARLYKIVDSLPTGGTDGNNFPNSLAVSGLTISLGRTGLSTLTANLDTFSIISWARAKKIADSLGALMGANNIINVGTGVPFYRTRVGNTYQFRTLRTDSTLLATAGDQDNLLSVQSNTSVQKVEVSKDGVLVGSRKRLNVIQGPNMVINVRDSVAADRIDITFESEGVAERLYPEAGLYNAGLEIGDSVLFPINDTILTFKRYRTGYGLAPWAGTDTTFGTQADTTQLTSRNRLRQVADSIISILNNVGGGPIGDPGTLVSIYNGAAIDSLISAMDDTTIVVKGFKISGELVEPTYGSQGDFLVRANVTDSTFGVGLNELALRNYLYERTLITRIDANTTGTENFRASGFLYADIPFVEITTDTAMYFNPVTQRLERVKLQAGSTGEPVITPGTITQYWRGDKTWQTLNTDAVTESSNLYFTNLRARQAISLTTNGSSGASTYNSTTGVLNIPNYTGEPIISAGTITQYWRGDKSWQTLNTTAVAEGTNQYFTQLRARQSISLTTVGTSGQATYDPNSGVLNIPNYGTGGSGGEPVIPTGNLTDYWRGDKTWQPLTTQAVTEQSNLYFTDLRARDAIWLTTTGNSGASTYDSLTGRFNIPNYTLAGLGGEPLITAGLSTQYWRGDKQWATLITTAVSEGTNLYFTNARARTAISLTTTGSSGSSTYNSSTGVLNVPTYTLAGLGGEPIITPGTTAQYWRGDKTWQTLTSTAVTEGTNLYYTDVRSRNAISLTTTGNSGPSTYTPGSGVLNVPNYTLAGLGGEPLISAGTTAQYWRGDKSWQTLNTAAVPENTNLYFTNLRARQAITLTTTGTSGNATYDQVTGVLNIPNYGTGGGGGEPVIAPGLITDYWRGDKTWQPLTTSVVAEGTNQYYTNTRARLAVSLTTTGSSGAATYNSGTGVFNVPNYTLAGLGGEPIITASGTARRYWTGYKTWGNLITDSLNEGVTNLFYTNARARLAISVNGLPLTYNSGTGVIGINQASGAQSGFITSTNFTNWESKQQGLLFQEDGVNLGTIGAVSTVNFAAGINATYNAGVVTVQVPVSTNVQYQDEGVNRGNPGDVTQLDFTGPGVEATYLNNKLTVAIAGGSGADGNYYPLTMTANNGLLTITRNTLTALVDSLSTTRVVEGSRLYFTDARARAAISLTTTGNSGISTYNQSTGVLNVPNYTLAGLGGEPLIASGTVSQYWRGDKTWQNLVTTAVSEGTNLYFTNARARLAISLTTTGTSGSSTYNSATGVLNVPTYTLAGLGGEPIISAGTVTQYWRGDKSWQTLNSTAVVEGTNLYFTNIRARSAISLTTTGNNGASTYNSTTGVLNVPVYTLAGLGGEPIITAGTTAQYWRGDKSWQTLNTAVVPESGNQYFTNARARAAVSLTTTGTSGASTYNSTTGVFNIPNYTLAGLGGEPIISAGTITQYWRGDKTWQTLNSTAVTEGTNLYYTNARARLAISLTTTGNSGASTYDNVSGVLNVPVYTLAGLGGEPIITGAYQQKRYWTGYKTWGVLNTDSVLEAGNQYFTQARARTSISLTTTGSSGSSTYNSSTGVLNVPTYTLAGLGGEPIISPGTTAQYWRGDKTWQTLSSTVVPEGTNQYFTQARARTSISLTTTGNSGAATYNNTTGVLNVPNYTLAGLGGEPLISAGTVSQYWRGDKSWQTLNTAAVPESTNLYFTNSRARLALSGGTGIGYDNTTGVITNTAPDIPITINQGANIQVTGTYPDFTISATDLNTQVTDLIVANGAGNTNTITLSQNGVANIVRTMDIGIRNVTTATGIPAPFTSLIKSNTGGIVTLYGIGAANNGGLSRTIDANGIYFSQIPNSTLQRVEVSTNNTLIGTKKRINFLNGTATTISGVVDNANDEIDVTINSTPVTITGTDGITATPNGVNSYIISGTTSGQTLRWRDVIIPRVIDPDVHNYQTFEIARGEGPAGTWNDIGEVFMEGDPFDPLKRTVTINAALYTSRTGWTLAGGGNSWVRIGTIPAEFRPNKLVYFTVPLQTANDIAGSRYGLQNGMTPAGYVYTGANAYINALDGGIYVRIGSITTYALGTTATEWVIIPITVSYHKTLTGFIN